jgi:hypothetical protein
MQENEDPNETAECNTKAAHFLDSHFAQYMLKLD